MLRARTTARVAARHPEGPVLPAGPKDLVPVCYQILGTAMASGAVLRMTALGGAR
jgi:hypothetical protein